MPSESRSENYGGTMRTRSASRTGKCPKEDGLILINDLYVSADPQTLIKWCSVYGYQYVSHTTTQLHHSNRIYFWAKSMDMADQYEKNTENMWVVMRRWAPYVINTVTIMENGKKVVIKDKRLGVDNWCTYPIDWPVDGGPMPTCNN